MLVGYYQFRPYYKDKEKNLLHIEKYLSKMEADLIVLPELCTTGYFFTDKDDLLPLSEKYDDGDAFSLFGKLAKKNNCAYVFGYSEKDGNRLYNSSAIVSPDGVIGNYRKVHLFYKEKLIFSPGDIGFPVYNVGGISIGMMICFDWYYPEAARTLALRGAQIICHPVNLVMPFCQKAMYTRAIENVVFTITANRYGSETLNDETLSFSGNSIIYNPSGKVLSSAEKEKDQLELVLIAPEQAESKQLNSQNHIFNDRKTYLYEV